MKVALIQPPYYLPFGNRSKSHRYDLPLGPLALAGAAGRGHDIEIINLNLPGELRKLKKKYDVAGIRCTAMDRDYAVKLAYELKKAGGACIVVAGGPHATLAPEDLLKERAIDYVVRGAGEEAFPRFLAAVERGAPVRGIAGLCFRERGNMHLSGIAEIADLDALPAVDYAAPPLERSLRRNGGMIPYETSRGCFNRCPYCALWKMQKHLRVKSMEKVFSDLRAAVRRSPTIRSVEIVDNTFNLSPGRVLDFCAVMKELSRQGGRTIRWTARMAPAGLDRTLISAMKDSGLAEVFLGFDSANARSLRKLRRDQTAAEMLRLIDILLDRGIETSVSFQLGLPWETAEEMWNTVSLAGRLLRKGAKAYLLRTTPFPGTDIRKLVTMRPDASPGDFTVDFSGAKRLTFRHPSVKDSELARMLRSLDNERKLNYLTGFMHKDDGRVS